MTETERKVLYYFDLVSSCVKDRNTFTGEACHAFDNLVERGFLEPVYIMTDAGRVAITADDSK